MVAVVLVALSVIIFVFLAFAMIAFVPVLVVVLAGGRTQSGKPTHLNSRCKLPYDGDGRRVMKSSGTLYWYGMSSDALDETLRVNGALLNV